VALPSDPSANRRGIFALCGAMVGFAINDALMKLVASRSPIGEAIFIRGMIAVFLAGTVLVWMGHVPAIRLAANRIVAFRSVMEAIVSVLFVTVLIRLPLAEISAILLAVPLIMTAMAVILIREDVGWRRWTAIAVGFAGALVIVRPGMGALASGSLLALLCAFLSASRDFVTRSIDPRIPTIVVSFLSAVSVSLSGLVLGLWENWRPLPWQDVALLGTAAAFMATGNYLIVIAFRGVDISVVAPFRYSLLIWAGLLGYFLFGELPDGWTALGMTMIVASGLYTLHRERVRKSDVATRVMPPD
jgi:drug/metabolite transporter (DMT)-like permease